jgi:hypothetical protein
MYAIVQYEDRPLGNFGPLVSRNKQYAERHKIHHIFVKKGYEEYPPWWRKVFLVKELLTHYEAIMWVDSDASIVGSFHFKDLFRDRHFVLSPNPPMLDNESLSMFSAPFCAGVWAVRSSPQGIALMERWAQLYEKKNWKVEGNNWTHLQGIYAGIAYEQGAFEMGIWRTVDFANWIHNLPSRTLNYLPKQDFKVKGKSCPSDVFAVHYWKGNRSHISQHWGESAFT